MRDPRVKSHWKNEELNLFIRKHIKHIVIPKDRTGKLRLAAKIEDICKYFPRRILNRDLSSKQETVVISVSDVLNGEKV